MKHLGNLTYAENSKTKKKRIGRGPGSGHGGTSTRGHKGQKSRKSYHHFSGFEGGQMPLNRRLPKFGFTNHFRTEYQIVNVGILQSLYDAQKISGSVGNEQLLQLGVINKKNMPLKILGNGDLAAALKVSADKFSNSAIEKIKSAGGTVTING